MNKTERSSNVDRVSLRHHHALFPPTHPPTHPLPQHNTYLKRDGVGNIDVGQEGGDRKANVHQQGGAQELCGCTLEKKVSNPKQTDTCKDNALTTPQRTNPAHVPPLHLFTLTTWALVSMPSSTPSTFLASLPRFLLACRFCRLAAITLALSMLGSKVTENRPELGKTSLTYTGTWMPRRMTFGSVSKGWGCPSRRSCTPSGTSAGWSMALHRTCCGVVGRWGECG